MFRTLEAHGVRYLLIGGLAATLHGSPLRTGDADICPAKDAANLERLARALEAMDARIRAPDAEAGVRFACDARFLAGVELLNLTTRFGDLDIAFRPAGTGGYDDLLHVLEGLERAPWAAPGQLDVALGAVLAAGAVVGEVLGRPDGR